MRTLIVFDSAYGNTAAVAETIERACASWSDTRLVDAKYIDLDELKNVDVLIVGSPTQGGRATIAVQEFIEQLPNLNGIASAAFDTRFALRGHGLPLNLLMKTIGFAAPKIHTALMRKHGRMVMPPIGFIVSGKRGPLGAGELKKAKEWAHELWDNITV